MVKVAINGFGRIGKSVLRAYFENGGKEKFGYDIVAINNPGDSTGAAHLFKYDSCFGTYTGDVELKDGKLIINPVKKVTDGDTGSTKEAASYTSGRVSTQNKQTFIYGRFECRAKVPKGHGYLPAFTLS